MKSFSLAALAAIVSAADTEGPATHFPEATYGSTKVNGSMSETQMINDADGSNTIYLNAIWINSIDGTSFPNGALIQNYAQWSSMTDPGKYMGVLCSTVYQNENNTAAQGIRVYNVDKSESLAVSNELYKETYWNEIGTWDSENQWFEMETDPAKTADFYGRTYSRNKYSTQNCGATAMMYYQENGEDVEGFEIVNELYWGLKNAGDITISSGFRIWEEPTDRKPWAARDAENVSWSAHDWGMEDPNAVVIVPDAEGEGEEMAESGAAALMAAATALTAIFMF